MAHQSGAVSRQSSSRESSVSSRQSRHIVDTHLVRSRQLLLEQPLQFATFDIVEPADCLLDGVLAWREPDFTRLIPIHVLCEIRNEIERRIARQHRYIK